MITLFTVQVTILCMGIRKGGDQVTEFSLPAVSGYVIPRTEPIYLALADSALQAVIVTTLYT